MVARRRTGLGYRTPDLSLGSFGLRGLELGIDFAGGTSYEVAAPDASVSDARSLLSRFGADGARIQVVDGDMIRIRSDIDDPARAAEIRDALSTELGPVETFEQVGPTWGDEVTDKAVRALVVFFIVVALYISVRLEWKMAAGALAAVAHDIVVSVGVYSLLGVEVTPATVIAFLTIMGYSLYDTIVVYDKVREMTWPPRCDRALHLYRVDEPGPQPGGHALDQYQRDLCVARAVAAHGRLGGAWRHRPARVRPCPARGHHRRLVLVAVPRRCHGIAAQRGRGTLCADP